MKLITYYSPNTSKVFTFKMEANPDENEADLSFSVPNTDKVWVLSFDLNYSCKDAKKKITRTCLKGVDINNIKISINGDEIDESMLIAEMKRIADVHERENQISYFVVEDRTKGA